MTKITQIQITEINGVKLTPDAIQALQNLQEDNNQIINNMADKIADISDYFAREFHTGKEFDAQDIEFKNYMNELSYIRRYIKDLRKP